MMVSLLVAAAVAASTPPPAPVPAAPIDTTALVRDASHAIDMGRLDQARIMTTRAIAAGAGGPPIERLLAKLDFMTGNFAAALSRYQALEMAGTRDVDVCGNGAVAALKLGRVSDAERLSACAVKVGPNSWRVWNARAVVADLAHEWSKADECYGKARELAPNEGALLNNLAWSKLMRGNWSAALPLLEEAAALEPGSTRILDNLELVRVALASDLPARRAGEADSDWAARLNDAGVAAELRGDRARAVAAFTQAVEASPVWYARAWNNLQAANAN